MWLGSSLQHNTGGGRTQSLGQFLSKFQHILKLKVLGRMYIVVDYVLLGPVPTELLTITSAIQK